MIFAESLTVLVDMQQCFAQIGRIPEAELSASEKDCKLILATVIEMQAVGKLPNQISLDDAKAWEKSKMGDFGRTREISESTQVYKPRAELDR